MRQPEGKLRILTGPAEDRRVPRTPSAVHARSEFVEPLQICNALRANVADVEWSLHRVHDGWGSLVYRARSEISASLIIKIGIFSNTHSPSEDCAYLLLAALYGGRAWSPKPVLLDNSGEYIPFPYLIMEALPGKSLLAICETGTSIRAEPMLIECVGCLGRFHRMTIRSSGWGPLNRSSVTSVFSRTPLLPLAGQIASVEDYVEHKFAPGLRECVRLGVLTESCADRISGELLQLRHPTGILHGDPSPRNFLFENGQLTGMIDGSARIGWTMEDLAAACVFSWEKAPVLALLDPRATMRRIARSFAKAAGLEIDQNALKLLIVGKCASRIRTARKLQDSQGLRRDVNLLESFQMTN